MLESKVREASHLNMRLQVKLIELLSGKKMNIALPDRKNPVPMIIESYEDGVSF